MILFYFSSAQLSSCVCQTVLCTGSTLRRHSIVNGPSRFLQQCNVAPCFLCRLLAATSFFFLFGQEMQLTGWDNVAKCDM